LMLMKTRSINKNELGLGKRFNTDEAGPRRLGFRGDNGYFRPNQSIDQGRFPHIRPPDYGDKATAMLWIGKNHTKID
jgi:hypothetical protein